MWLSELESRRSVSGNRACLLTRTSAARVVKGPWFEDNLIVYELCGLFVSDFSQLP
jgi:hypothetical protein